MKVLVSGCGGIGRRHIKNLQEMGHVVIAYDPFCDRHRKDWDKNIGKIKVPDSNTAFEEALEDVSHVVLALPPGCAKYEQMRATLNAGKQLFVEKPIHRDGPDGIYSIKGTEAILDLAKKKGITIGVGYQFRSHPEVIKIKQRIQSAYRKPGTYVSAIFQYTGDRNQWPGPKKTDILGECSHTIDLPQFIFDGKLNVLSVDEVRPDSRIEIAGTIGLVLITIRIDWDLKGQPSRHQFWINASRSDESLFFSFNEKRESDRKDLDFAYQKELEWWILHGRPDCTGEDGLKVLKTIQRIREFKKADASPD